MASGVLEVSPGECVYVWYAIQRALVEVWTLSGFDSQGFRKALGHFLTGVTIITAVGADGVPKGFTANSFTSVSLDPPLVLVCIGKTATSVDAFAEGSKYCVNILSDLQRPLSNLFASKSADKFVGEHWAMSGDGCPYIKESLVVFECTTDRLIDAGDHYIALGLVKRFDVNAGRPLGFCRGTYVLPALTQEVVGLAGTTPRVGALLEWRNSLLLLENEQGELSLPAGTLLGEPSIGNSLLGSLAQLDIAATVDFLFSVYEDEKSQNNIFYRGSFDPGPKAPPQLIFPFDDIPWDRVRKRDVKMARRFIDEKRREVAGLYVGGQVAGSIYSFAGSESWRDEQASETNN
jgi:flavin reductase (DIM6/NTAB) family NADH-FMN oxidoreductase RutF